jgi:hypothetical protein
MNTVDEKVVTFNSKWWDDFISKTENLSKTTVFKNCLTTEETKLMRKYLLDIIAELASMRTVDFGYRVFIEGVQQGYKSMEKIYDLPPLEDEDFEQWANRCFEDKKFGMIINRGEKFSPKLGQLVSNKILPLLDKIGIPRLGITFTIFIGNYGWTPIGIHTDAKGENVLHFHLGNGSKTMYTWDKEIYESLTTPIERINNVNVEPYIPYANEFPYDEGDLYFMPQGEYHIGKSDDLSMGLTLWFNNHVKSALSRRTIQVIIDQFLQENDEILALDKNDITDISNFKESLDLFAIPDEMDGLTFKELLVEAYKEFRYSLYSNGGFWTRPFPKEQDYSFSLIDIIEIEKPYLIYFHESLDKKNLHIYVRGSKIVLNNHKGIVKVVEEINRGTQISVEKLNNLLDKDWESSICFYILNLLYLHHGIKVIQ